MINWIPLTDASQLDSIRQASFQRPQVIFKHSTRCSISHMAKSRLERSGAPEGIDFHFLDLLAYRSVSDQVARDFHVHHESPQVILLKQGDVVFDESHNAISMDEIVEQAAVTSKTNA